MARGENFCDRTLPNAFDLANWLNKSGRDVAFLLDSPGRTCRIASVRISRLKSGVSTLRQMTNTKF